MSDKSLPTRIPAEEIGEFTSWMIPPIQDSSRVLSTAEKEARERKERLLRQGKEKVEIIEMPSAPKTGLTAQEMQEIIESAEKEGYAQGHQKGYDEGRAQGYEAGRQQAYNETRMALVNEQQRFHQLANALLNPLTAQDNDIEHYLLDIICTLTQSVIERELVTDSGVILDVVKKAVDALPVGHQHLRLFLNPDDLAAVETYAQEQQLSWSFVGDPQLTPGGCKIETSDSRVDFSVSSRLQQVLVQFLQGQLANEDTTDTNPTDDTLLGQQP